MGVPLAHGTPMSNARVLMGRPWAVLGLGLGLRLHGQSHGGAHGRPMGEPMEDAHGPPMGRCSRDAREQCLWASHGRSMSAAHGTAHEQLTMGGPWTI